MKQRIITSIFLIFAAIIYLFIGAIYQEWKDYNLWYFSYIFMLVNTILLAIAVFEVLQLRVATSNRTIIKSAISLLAMLLFWFPILQDLHFEPYSIKYSNVVRIEWLKTWMVFLVYAVFFVIFWILAKFILKLTMMDMLINFIYVIFLILAFKTMNYLMLQKGYGVVSIALLLLITISNDTFAYLGGKGYGKHKLAPKISPLKTWEGAITGVFSAVIISLVYTLLMTELVENHQPFAGFFSSKTMNYKYLIYFLLFLFLSIVSQVGDLMFSILKRYFNIKDFGNYLPGHGGLLDRIDSLVLVLIVVGFFITLLN